MVRTGDIILPPDCFASTPRGVELSLLQKLAAEFLQARQTLEKNSRDKKHIIDVEARGEEERQKAITFAKNTEGVPRLVDYLVVRPE